MYRSESAQILKSFHWYAGAQASSVLVSAMHAKRISVPSISPAPVIILHRVTGHLAMYAAVVVTRLGCHAKERMRGILGGS